MANKRMFSLCVVDTDDFMDMPTSTQALYFHLGMHGDDDGFVSSPRKIARSTGCNDDDLRLLAAKGFIIPFDSGVIVITDWKINNNLRNDRYKKTIYQDEKSMLREGKNGKYALGANLDTNGIPMVANLEPQHNITEHNLTKPNITESVEADKPLTRSRFVPPTVNEVSEYCKEKGYSVDTERFVNYYTSNGWMVGKNKMKDWKAAVGNWNGKEQERGKTEPKLSWTIGTVV